MEIRFAKPEDVAGILKLLKQVGRVHHEGRPDIFRHNAQKYGASRVLRYGFCIIKEHKNDPVIADHTELYIDDLCVDENCRGQHIGTAIYEAILRYAKMRKCYNVTLNVWSCNENAMAFYKSLGMQPQKVGMETILDHSE